MTILHGTSIPKRSGTNRRAAYTLSSDLRVTWNGPPKPLCASMSYVPGYSRGKGTEGGMMEKPMRQALIDYESLDKMAPARKHANQELIVIR